MRLTQPHIIYAGRYLFNLLKEQRLSWCVAHNSTRKNASKKNHYHVIVLESPSKRRFCGTWGFYFIPFE